MKSIVVIGGGISGLSAAWAAAERLKGVAAVTVVEREREVGGKAQTLHEQGFVVEAGPTGYLDNEPAVDRVVEAAGLTKIPANQAAARRFLVRKGRMREIEANPVRFIRAGILGPLGLLRVPLEFLVPGKRDDADESVWQFAARRIGRQGADRLIAPMMLGIFAGDAKRLSLAAALPRLHEIETTYGSLFRGLLAIRRAGKKNAAPSGPSGVLTSFEGGLQTLPRRLAARGTFALRLGAEAREVVPREGGGYRVALAGGEVLDADAVVLSGEPWAMAAVTRGAFPDLARPMESIACPPVAVVALGYGPAAFDKVPKGFGVIIPRGEGYRILGCLWDTHLFAGRSPDGKLLIRAMIGGSQDTAAGELSDAELIGHMKDDVARLMGLSLRPLYERVVVWPRAIPQYEIGHLDKVRAIEAETGRRPGLFVAGNFMRGVAFGKAVVQGLDAGDAAASHLGAPAVS